MRQEVEALLALQEDDLKIREIENEIRALDPHLAELDKRRDSESCSSGSPSTKRNRSATSINSRM